MGRTVVISAAVGIAVLGSPGPAGANPGGTPANPLNAGQETTGSTSLASGFFTYAITGDQICWTLTVRNLTGPAVAAHIHMAPRHMAAPPLVPLMPPDATGRSEGCTTNSAAGSITADPGAFYVNVHTVQWPGGEIRGQLK